MPTWAASRRLVPGARKAPSSSAIPCLSASATAQLSALTPNSESGLDMLARVTFLILAMSRCNARWSIDAVIWRRFGREVPTEILLHIERAGDRLFPGRGWVGALGRKLRIEAFSIRPLERLAPADVEMKGFLPNNGETPWVPGGTLCGTRGRGLPLTGFAVRVVAPQAERFEVAYQGSFFAGGISPAWTF